jgi:ADP-heptose:LPS heptosyltransferase
MKHWNLKGVWISGKGRTQLDKLDPINIKNIAVIRHAALGDMVLTRNFLIEAKKIFPNTKITFSVVSNYTRGIPEDLIDRLHILDISGKKKNAVFHLYHNTRELGEHDLIFDLATTSRSIWLCKLNKAKLKIGFPYRTLYRYLFYNAVVPRSDVNFEADDMLNLLKIFGLKVTYPLRFDMPGEPVNVSDPYILYFTSASIIDKCWPLERFSDLIKLLSENYPTHKHLVLEGFEKWESIDPVMDNFKENKKVSPLKSVETVEEIVSYVKGARLVVSNDTSVRNIAIACGIPSVGIFFETPPYRYLPQYSIHKAVFNSDCSIPGVKDVYGAAQSLLDKGIK